MTSMRDSGFSLIELLITLALLSILLATAWRVNQLQLRKGQEREGQRELMLLAHKLEEYRFLHHSYEGAAGTQSQPKNTGKSWLMNSDNNDLGGSVSYELRIVEATTDNYLIAAIALEPRLSSLAYQSSGVKFKDRNLDGTFSKEEQCWQCP